MRKSLETTQTWFRNSIQDVLTDINLQLVFSSENVNEVPSKQFDQSQPHHSESIFREKSRKVLTLRKARKINLKFDQPVDSLFYLKDSLLLICFEHECILLDLDNSKYFEYQLRFPRVLRVSLIEKNNLVLLVNNHHKGDLLDLQNGHRSVKVFDLKNSIISTPLQFRSLKILDIEIINSLFIVLISKIAHKQTSLEKI